MPKSAPRLRLSWIPTWSFHTQATSPARRFWDAKHQALVTRSAAHPIAALIMNRRKRLRGTALLFVATTDDAGDESAFMIVVILKGVSRLEESGVHARGLRESKCALNQILRSPRLPQDDGVAETPSGRNLARDSLAVVFLAFGTLDADRSIRNRIESGFSNYAIALNAFTEFAFADSVESGIDQTEGIPVDFHQAQREFLFEVVAAQFGHVDRHGVAIASFDAGFPQRDLRHGSDIAAQPAANGLELFLVREHFRLLHVDSPGRLIPSAADAAIRDKDSLF